jgi:DNA-directed RNA polymerases I, II, and III subunit RPABC1
MYKSLWQCNRTILDMLKARGYGDQIDVDDGDIDQAKLADKYELFEDKINELCSDLGTPENKLNQKVLDKLTYLRQHSFTGEWIYVFFVMHKIGVTLIDTYVKCMDDSSVSRAILISVPSDEKGSDDQSILTPFAVKQILKYNQTANKIIEHFYTDALTINILKHAYQPKTIKILTTDEAEHIIGLMSGTIDKTPPIARIEPEDPVARFLGLQVGDVIECICHSSTVGETKRYRVCMFS